MNVNAQPVARDQQLALAAPPGEDESDMALVVPTVTQDIVPYEQGRSQHYIFGLLESGNDECPPSPPAIVPLPQPFRRSTTGFFTDIYLYVSPTTR